MVAGQIPLEEYLSTTYHPDCDYVDGELLERNVGEVAHGRFQGQLASYLLSLEPVLGIWVAIELRVQISAQRIRIPDITVMLGEPEGRIVTVAPFLLIEILSEWDSLRTIQDRIDDYRAMGVPHIWVIDPETATGWDASSGAP
ncbi:MAG: Uma2 family endonuclease, partial [Acidobacteria bacterium]|nr:Uma2 family endonuclease [Acidobacteriota bacterium]